MAESADLPLVWLFESGHAHPLQNFGATLTRTYEDGPSLDRRGSRLFSQANKQKSLAQDPEHRPANIPGGGEKHIAVANRSRRKKPAPAEMIALVRLAARARPESNASFETKHRLPATFPVLVS